MNTPASTASVITDEQIEKQVYEEFPAFDDYQDGPSMDRIITAVRAVLALAAPTAQPAGQEAAGHFLRSGWSPKGDGTKLWEQVTDEHKGDADVVPLYERAAVEPSQPADPMDTPLPCDVTVGGGTMRKGVPLRSLVLRMKHLYKEATGNDADQVANRTPEERAALAQPLFDAVAKAMDQAGETDFICKKCGVDVNDASRTPAPAAPCVHRWVDARNAVVESGEVCRDCGAMRAGNTPAAIASSTKASGGTTP